MSNVRLTPRRAKFIELYFGDCMLNATEAARQAGFAHPRVAGSQLVRILAPILAAKEDEQKSRLEATGRELRETLTSISRDPDHKDRLKAIELLARINGMLSDRVNVTVERKEAEAALVAAIEQLRTNQSN